VVTEPAVEVKGATVGYHGREPVLRDVDLVIQPGELVGIVGPSGSGKTTLLRLLTGQVRGYAGDVRILGQTVRAGKAVEHLGYVPQIGAGERDFPLTVQQAVLLGMAADSARKPWFSAVEKTYSLELLAHLGLEGYEDRSISELSGGQYQRMLLARAMARHSEVILLDEPTSGVDMQTRRDILRLLATLNAEGLTVVLTTHNLNWVASHLPRVVCMNGRVIADGSPQDVFTPEVMRETYGAELRVVRDGDALLLADQKGLFEGVGT
jgi:zinc/manganese transport system ATP-binding protein